MKLLKFAIVGLIAFGGTQAFAQEEEIVKSEEVKNNPEEKVNQKLDKLAEELALTDDQKEKAKEIHLRFQEKRHAVKADTTISVEDKKSQLIELRTSQKEEIKAILNDDQVAKFEELEAKRKEQHKKRTTGEIANDQTERMKEALDLTDEQVEQVRTLNLKVANKIAAIKSDDSIAPEKKKEFIQGNKQDHKNVMKSILTDEQFVKYEEYLAKRKKLRENKVEGKQIETATE